MLDLKRITSPIKLFQERANEVDGRFRISALRNVTFFLIV